MSRRKIKNLAARKARQKHRLLRDDKGRIIGLMDKRKWLAKTDRQAKKRGKLSDGDSGEQEGETQQKGTDNEDGSI